MPVQNGGFQVVVDNIHSPSAVSSPASSRQSSMDLSRQNSLERKRAAGVELARKNSMERKNSLEKAKADSFSKVFMAPWTTSTQRAQETAAMRSLNLVKVTSYLAE